MKSSLQIYNTLTGKKEPFQPLEGNTVRIYSCGPTVYDLSHLGHARKEITWDVIQRYLRHIGYDVIFVRNITDVDDKIINRAKEMKRHPDQVAREFTFEFWRDMNDLNVLQPDFEPRATEYIAKMISFIDELIKSGHAYASGGDVYFSVSSFKEYGKLSKQNLDQLQAGARELVRSQAELAELKKNSADFALWKGASADEVGWESPWGRGRPGWHLECSTMIRAVLGESIDIHGGGEDLVFPHHENEIAQSESLLDKPLAKFWVHNGFIRVNEEKMSKSLGNFSTIQDLLANYPADALRLLVLQTHYRSPIDFTEESLNAAKTGVHRLVRLASQEVPESNGVGQDFDSVRNFEAEFAEAMNNDFNTAVAVSALFNLSDHVGQTNDAAEKTACIHALRKYADILGLTLKDTRKNLDHDTAGQIVDVMLELRKNARANKDFATADKIRNELIRLGINVMDIAGGGSTWERT